MKLSQFAKKAGVTSRTAFHWWQQGQLKHKTEGRNVLVYEWKAVSKRALKRGMISLTGLGELVKSINQGYNKQHLWTSRRMKAFTDNRNRRIQHQLNLASRAIIDRPVDEGIGTLVIGKNVFWKVFSTAYDGREIEAPQFGLSGLP